MVLTILRLFTYSDSAATTDYSDTPTDYVKQWFPIEHIAYTLTLDHNPNRKL